MARRAHTFELVKSTGASSKQPKTHGSLRKDAPDFAGEVKPKTKIKSKSNIMKRKLLTNSLSLLTASAHVAGKKPSILIICEY